LNFSNAAVGKVRDFVYVSQRSRVNVGGPKVVFHLPAGNVFVITGTNTIINADINIPNGTLLLAANNITMTGLFTVKEMNATLANNVNWYATNNCTQATPGFSSNRESSDEISEDATPAETQLMETEFSVKVMQNPSHNDFTLVIKSNDRKTPVTVTLMNMQGNVISQQKTIAGSNLKVGETRWAGGMYVAEIIQGERRKLIRLVKL
jgi:hypothetical protein